MTENTECERNLATHNVEEMILELFVMRSNCS